MHLDQLGQLVMPEVFFDHFLEIEVFFIYKLEDVIVYPTQK